MNAVIHAIGTVNESKRIACRAWQTVCGDALDTHIDGADTRDDQTNVVFCALYVIILQALVEAAEGIRIPDRPHGCHGNPVFQCTGANACWLKQLSMMCHKVLITEYVRSISSFILTGNVSVVNTYRIHSLKGFVCLCQV